MGAMLMSFSLLLFFRLLLMGQNLQFQRVKITSDAPIEDILSKTDSKNILS